MKTFILPHGQQALLDALAQIDPNKRVKVTVDAYKRSRSLGMNAAHWAGVITPLAEFIGDSPEEVHRDLCGLYWGWVETQWGGRKPKRTTTHNEAGEKDVLDWEKMSNFMHFCKAKAAEIGAPISEAA